MNPRISVDPNVCGGQPCIAGTRVPVHIILSHLAAGETNESVLRGFPSITKEDIEACFDYAAYLCTEKVLAE